MNLRNATTAPQSSSQPLSHSAFDLIFVFDIRFALFSTATPFRTCDLFANGTWS